MGSQLFYGIRSPTTIAEHIAKSVIWLDASLYFDLSLQYKNALRTPEAKPYKGISKPCTAIKSCPKRITFYRNVIVANVSRKRLFAKARELE